jgi:hypothetical protein
MFLATPAQGLKDTYLSANTALAGVKLGAVYHDFSADKSSAGVGDYGTEWDAVATRGFGKNYTVGAKLAQFSTKLPASYPNTNKLWLWAEAKF